MTQSSSRQSLTEVRGDLPLAALCVGQFRAPCQIDVDRLLVMADEALLQALAALGLTLSPSSETFTPAPLFAPEEVILEGVAHAAGRLHVKTHVSRHHDEEALEEDISRNSNA